MGWAATLAMGLVLGLLGGGGGILTVPILVGLFHLPATQATGASLLVVGAAAAVGAVQGFWQRQVHWRAGLLLAVPSMAGAWVSRRLLVPAIPPKVFGFDRDDALLVVFAVLMLIVFWRMVRPSAGQRVAEAPWPVAMAAGLAIGVISGTLGAGGGFLILPVLTLLLGVSMREAIPTSLFVISVQSLGGFTGELGKPIPWEVLMPMTGVALAGMGVGIALRTRAPKELLQRLFAALILVVAIWMFVKAST